MEDEGLTDNWDAATSTGGLDWIDLCRKWNIKYFSSISYHGKVRDLSVVSNKGCIIIPNVGSRQGDRSHVDYDGRQGHHYSACSPCQ